jgi:hypothetical protein
MRRHEADAVSLVAGLLFLVVAAVHITARATDTELNLRWMVPAVLVLLGLLGLLGAIRSPRGSAGDVAMPADHVEAAGPGEAAAPVPPAEHVDSADDADTAVLDKADEASTER